MSSKMLIDASHPEETRVVVTRGNRIEEFDLEAQDRKQLRGNIYLARVTRVEPSLQAAFVEYGGNRQGFLAFSEIHPDYYQIPVADREALLEEEAREAAAAEAEDEEEITAKGHIDHDDDHGSDDGDHGDDNHGDDGQDDDNDDAEASDDQGKRKPRRARRRRNNRQDDENETIAAHVADEKISEPAPQAFDIPPVELVGFDEEETEALADAVAASGKEAKKHDNSRRRNRNRGRGRGGRNNRSRGRGGRNTREGADDHDEGVEAVGTSEDALDEVAPRRRSNRRNYKIQEVIKRRQVLLVQVVKEERGNKGAAMTTYMSLAGRYSVLMPNTARGGGISRKISNVSDRKRLKSIVEQLDVPKGMGVILRTAGANREMQEIQRDYEYLMRMWDNVRDLTMTSTAPCLVYEEGNLIKRSIRDLYNKEISQISVSGDRGFKQARDFMRMLMPSQERIVRQYNGDVPILSQHGIATQLDRMLHPSVTLKSGGYIIINQTEALVSIDVNSGRSTREHSIEDTAIQTNLEAAEEIARQLKLRDLAGLIVIDFIDMEEKRNNRAVEKKVKDCLKNDRARIQVGRISSFGLMEMSRQRMRSSVLESAMQTCPHCEGIGLVRSHASFALHVVRAIEEHLLKDARFNVTVKANGHDALHILNHQRKAIGLLEAEYGISILVVADSGIGTQEFTIEKGELAENTALLAERSAARAAARAAEPDDDIVVEETQESASEDAVASDQDEQEDGNKKRRRRRRKRGGNKDAQAENADANGAEDDQSATTDAKEPVEAATDTDSEDKNADEAPSPDEEPKKRKRTRGRRGGKKNRPEDNDADQTASDEASEETSPATESGEDQGRVVETVEPVMIEAVESPAPQAASEVAAEAVEIVEAEATAPAEEAKQPQGVVSTVVSTDGEEQKTEAAPQKKGWWQRKSFF